MKYRRFGRTDLKVSVIGIGAWQFGGEWGRSFTAGEVARILGQGKDLGINLIDTAECYGDHLSEELIGRAVEADRADWIIATKFGHRYEGHIERSERWSPEEVRQQLEESLRALRTDYVDLYQFHSGTDAVFDNDDLWTMLNDEVQAGTIRHLGISIASNDNLYQTQKACEVGASVIQVIYNRLDRAPEKRVFPTCISQDLGVMARVPLASGFLSGKYRPGAVFDNPQDVRSSRDQDQIDQLLAEVETIAQTEVPEGVPMAPWALAWCLQHPAVSCAIPGCKSVEQVIANASAADLDMVREDHAQAWDLPVPEEPQD